MTFCYGCGSCLVFASKFFCFDLCIVDYKGFIVSYVFECGYCNCYVR